MPPTAKLTARPAMLGDVLAFCCATRVPGTNLGHLLRSKMLRATPARGGSPRQIGRFAPSGGASTRCGREAARCAGDRPPTRSDSRDYVGKPTSRSRHRCRARGSLRLQRLDAPRGSLFLTSPSDARARAHFA
jgi:hypothetical protein